MQFAATRNKLYSLLRHCCGGLDANRLAIGGLPCADTRVPQGVQINHVKAHLRVGRARLMANRTTECAMNKCRL
jgi:hypothetical protein